MVTLFDPTSAPVFGLTSDRYPSGELVVVSFQGREEISRPFSFEIVVAATGVEPGAFERDLLGQPAHLTLHGDDGGRVFHGIVRRVEVEGVSGDRLDRHHYRVWLAPRLWLLGRGKNSRIFQDLAVREIVDRILGEWNVPRRWSLVGSYKPRRYCVQHQESDLRFLQRLLAEEGILYFFDHPVDGAGLAPIPPGRSGDEVVVFSDSAHLAEPIAGEPTLELRDSGGMVERDGDVRRFRVRHRIEPGAALLREFDFLRPSLDLHARAAIPRQGDVFDVARLSVYDHHGEFEGVPIGDDAARVHLEQHRSRAVVAAGESRCRRLSVGRWFELHHGALPEHGGRYTILRVEHEGRHPEALQALPSGVSAGEVYRNRFHCIPVDVTCRPKRPRRRIQQVLETATVVGPEGQEIHTDEHGRIRVQFHWDRDRAKNENSSCWIRVMQAWAGAGWGFQFIPRVGMEVLVMFLGGDTDRPMVIGSAYNAEHPLPFPLPINKTLSGIRTQTTRGGGGYNELSFEDRRNWERVHLHAQRDFDTVVLRNHTGRVGGNRTDYVEGNQSLLVGGNSLGAIGGNVSQVVAGNDTRNVEGNASHTVRGEAVGVVGGRAEQRFEDELRIRVAKQEELVVGDDLSLEVRGALTTRVGRHDERRSHTLHVEGVSSLWSSGITEIVSKEGILLRCGDSVVHLGPDRVEIDSPTIALRAGGGRAILGDDQVKVHGDAKVLVTSDDAILLKSSGAGVSLASEAKIDGSAVKLKSPVSGDDSLSEEAAQPTTIELVDDESNPIPYQRYRVILEDGSEIGGVLDEDGKAVLSLDASATVVFPDLGGAERA